MLNLHLNNKKTLKEKLKTHTHVNAHFTVTQQRNLLSSEIRYAKLQYK